MIDTTTSDLHTQSTRRAARRIALAGGATAIAAIAFSGVASAAPPVVNTHTINGPFGGSTTRTTVAQINIPRPGNPNTHLVFAVSNARSVTTPGGPTRTVGGGINVDINPAHPLFGSTVSIGGGATSTRGGLHGISVGLGVQNGHIIPPVQTIP